MVDFAHPNRKKAKKPANKSKIRKIQIEIKQVLFAEVSDGAASRDSGFSTKGGLFLNPAPQTRGEHVLERIEGAGGIKVSEQILVGEWCPIQISGG